MKARLFGKLTLIGLIKIKLLTKFVGDNDTAKSIRSIARICEYEFLIEGDIA